MVFVLVVYLIILFWPEFVLATPVLQSPQYFKQIYVTKG